MKLITFFLLVSILTSCLGFLAGSDESTKTYNGFPLSYLAAYPAHQYEAESMILPFSGVISPMKYIGGNPSQVITCYWIEPDQGDLKKFNIDIIAQNYNNTGIPTGCTNASVLFIQNQKVTSSILHVGYENDSEARKITTRWQVNDSANGYYGTFEATQGYVSVRPPAMVSKSYELDIHNLAENIVTTTPEITVQSKRSVDTIADTLQECYRLFNLDNDTTSPINESCTKIWKVGQDWHSSYTLGNQVYHQVKTYDVYGWIITITSYSNESETSNMVCENEYDENDNLIRQTCRYYDLPENTLTHTSNAIRKWIY